MNEDCIFCKIVSGEMPAHKVWENDTHLAFLTIFPNTEGFTVVISKEHKPSYAFDNSDEDLTALALAAKKVGKMIDAAYPNDVARTGMILEGFGVDHLHAKLFPMHNTASDSEWKRHKSNVDKYFENYEGYISSHDYKRADDEVLAKIAKKIRGES